MESEGKYANTRTRKDRFTENQKQQIRNLNISGKNVEQQIRNILVNSQGRSKFAPEAVRELMKQPSYLKSLANSESQYVNIAQHHYNVLVPTGSPPQRPLPQKPTKTNNKPPPHYNVLQRTPEPLYATLN